MVEQCPFKALAVGSSPTRPTLLLTCPSPDLNINTVMNKQLTNEYYDMFEKFKRREITQQQWYAFCASVLSVIMEENKDVFVRLKNR